MGYLNNNIKTILELLSDGAFHSGSSLGKKLGLTRNKYGIELEAKTNYGYRIPGGLELLDKKIIEQYIGTKIAILDETPSTNTYLAELIKTEKSNISICLAESQSAGRGRLGRKWFSPYARNIYLSMYWCFTKEAGELSGLSLVVAVAIAQALEDYGIKQDITLKWPNDVFWRQCKLAGILIDLYGEAHHACHTIIGVGLNVQMPEKISKEINQHWCDIAKITGNTPQRNKLAGLLLNEISIALKEFQKNGLKPFLKKWHKLDIAYEKKVIIITPQQQKISGIGCGINDKGHFLLKDRYNKIQSFVSGEVSLKIYNI